MPIVIQRLAKLNIYIKLRQIINLSPFPGHILDCVRNEHYFNSNSYNVVTFSPKSIGSAGLVLLHHAISVGCSLHPSNHFLFLHPQFLLAEDVTLLSNLKENALTIQHRPCFVEPAIMAYEEKCCSKTSSYMIFVNHTLDIAAIR